MHFSLSFRIRASKKEKRQRNIIHKGRNSRSTCGHLTKNGIKKVNLLLKASSR